MSTIGQILNAFTLLGDPVLLLLLVIGFVVGIVFGGIPGLTATLAIVLLLPAAYGMSMNAALFMCMGIYMAGMYSGSITAITLNIPGTPSGAMTAIDGHKMMMKGQGAKALGHATFASAVGGVLGVLLLIAVSPLAVRVALMIHTPGKTSLIIFAVVVISALYGKNWAKAFMMTIIGMVLTTFGMGVRWPTPRFTFGTTFLLEGFNFVPVVIGAFAFSELLNQSVLSNEEYKMVAEASSGIKIYRRDFIPVWEEIKAIGFWRYLKSSCIGYFIGVLPWAGGSMAAFVAYAEGKRSSAQPELYGKGFYEGIACAESANNAVCGGALVPMLTFGIPGDGVTAIILGVMMVYGVVPGPEIMTMKLYLVAPMYVALFFAAVVLIPLSLILFGPYYIKVVRVNRPVLYAVIAIVSLTGAYAATYSFFQMVVAIGVGVMVYFMRKQHYPPVPFILGALLGSQFEEYFRRTLSLSNNNPLIFLTSPDSLVFLVLALFFVVLLNSFQKVPG